jgi:hypothetical protein
LRDTRFSLVSRIQFVAIHLLWLLIPFIFVYVFPSPHLWLIIIIILIYTLNWLVFLKFKGNYLGIVVPSVLVAIALNVTLTLHFYPNLLSYQADSVAGKFIVENKIPNDNFYTLNGHSYSLNYYARKFFPTITKDSLSNLKANAFVLTDKQGLEVMDQLEIKYSLVKKISYFKVSALNINFLLKSRRDRELKMKYLVRIEGS